MSQGNESRCGCFYQNRELKAHEGGLACDRCGHPIVVTYEYAHYLHKAVGCLREASGDSPIWKLAVAIDEVVTRAVDKAIDEDGDNGA